MLLHGDLDGTIVVTAIPQMSASLGALPSSTALVITTYLLTLAVLIPLSAWMTQRSAIDALRLHPRAGEALVQAPAR